MAKPLTMSRPIKCLPLYPASGAFAAAIVASLGLLLAAMGCQWTVAPHNRDWWRFTFLYTNQALCVLWLLILPAMVSGTGFGNAIALPGTPTQTRSLCWFWLSALAASFPAFVWSGWLSRAGVGSLLVMAFIQLALAVFSWGAGMWLVRLAATTQARILALLAALVFAGPMLIYLQAEFFGNLPHFWWRWMPSYLVVQIVDNHMFARILPGVLTYIIAGLVMLAAARIMPVRKTNND